MLKSLLLSALIFSQVALSQDVQRGVDLVDTENNLTPFSIPIYMDVEGNLNIIDKNMNTSMSFRPNMQVNLKLSKSLYIKPIHSNHFALVAQDKGLEWIQVKRQRWEFGLGIGALAHTLPLYAGLTPFKGAQQVMVRHLKNKDDGKSAPRLPRSFEEMEEWREGDKGTFQTFGGVQILAGVKYSMLNVVSVGVTIQNLFSIVIEKKEGPHVHLSIIEEKTNKRRIETGAVIATGRVNFFNGKSLSSHFKLNLEEPSHHELYLKAIKGNLVDLQSELPIESQKIKWKGSERIGYIGIPGVAGKFFASSDYIIQDGDKNEHLDIKSRRNAGVFVPLRNHNKLVYQTDDTLVLFWYSEMLKTSEEVFTKRFLAPGLEMGAKGFDLIIPRGTRLESTLSQMGMSFTRQELENVSPELLEEILQNFSERCHKMNLKCSRKKRFNKIVKKLMKFRTQTWEEARDELGFLMMEEPALIHSYVKSIKANKKVFFRFLNQKYQSMEGSVQLEI